MNTTVDAMLSYNLHMPQVFIYDNAEDGWSPITSYRGMPPIPGDRITVVRRWRDIENNVSKEEVQHFIVVKDRHLFLLTDHSTGGTRIKEKWEIGADRVEEDAFS